MDVSFLTNGNVVVIIEHDEVAKLQVTSQAGSFLGDTLLGTAIPKNSICVVVGKLVAGLVESCGSVSLSNG